MPVRLIYSSEAAPWLSTAELEQMLHESRIRNKARGITGVLVLVDGVFLQVLEGERFEVDDLMSRIEVDPRHSGVKVFHREEVDGRAFDSWSMAYLHPGAAEVARWAGLDGSSTLPDVLASLERGPNRLPPLYVNILEALATQ